MATLKVGQKVRFKSYEELKRIGERHGIKVDRDFIYSTKVFTLRESAIVFGNSYRVKEWQQLDGRNDWSYHEDFFQPAYKLDDRFKEL